MGGPELWIPRSHRHSLEILEGEGEVLIVETFDSGRRHVIKMTCQEAQRIAGALNQAALKGITRRIQREEGVIGGL